VVIDIGIPGRNQPSRNVMQGNVIRRDQPDMFWDGSGVGSVFRADVYVTSVPDGLC
jgi:hypothetical protein